MSELEKMDVDGSSGAMEVPNAADPNRPLYTDVALKSKDGTLIYTTKRQLYLHSERFKVMFESNFNDKKKVVYEMKDYSPTTIQFIVDWMDLKAIKIDHKNCISIYRLSDEYLFTHLKQKSFSFMVESYKSFTIHQRPYIIKYCLENEYIGVVDFVDQKLVDLLKSQSPINDVAYAIFLDLLEFILKRSADIETIKPLRLLVAVGDEDLNKGLFEIAEKRIKEKKMDGIMLFQILMFTVKASCHVYYWVLWCIVTTAIGRDFSGRLLIRGDSLPDSQWYSIHKGMEVLHKPREEPHILSSERPSGSSASFARSERTSSVGGTESRSEPKESENRV